MPKTTAANVTSQVSFFMVSPCAAGAPRPSSSRAIAGVDPVEHAQIGRPVGGAAAAVVLLVLRDGLGADRRWDFDQLGAGCFHRQLDFGGFEQMLHQAE